MQVYPVQGDKVLHTLYWDLCTPGPAEVGGATREQVTGGTHGQSACQFHLMPERGVTAACVKDGGLLRPELSLAAHAPRSLEGPVQPEAPILEERAQSVKGTAGLCCESDRGHSPHLTWLHVKSVAQIGP